MLIGVEKGQKKNLRRGGWVVNAYKPDQHVCLPQILHIGKTEIEEKLRYFEKKFLS